MSDTNDMRQEFEAWFSDKGKAPKAVTQNSNVYELMSANQSWIAWQAATERAAKLAYDAGMDGLAHVIRQGSDT